MVRIGMIWPSGRVMRHWYMKFDSSYLENWRVYSLEPYMIFKQFLFSWLGVPGVVGLLTVPFWIPFRWIYVRLWWRRRHRCAINNVSMFRSCPYLCGQNWWEIFASWLAINSVVSRRSIIIRWVHSSGEFRMPRRSRRSWVGVHILE